MAQAIMQQEEMPEDEQQPAQPAAPEGMADDLKRVVLAGTKLMYDPKTFPIFKQGLEQDQPLPQKLATQAAGLIKMLDERAKPKIPRKIVVPAAVALLVEMASFMKQAGMIDEVSEDDLGAAIEALIRMVMMTFGGQQQEQPAEQPPEQPQPEQPAPMGGIMQGAMQ